LGSVIKIRCESGNVPDVRLARHSTPGDEYFNSATVIKTPLLFVVVEHGKRRGTDSREQETLHSGIALRDDIGVAVLGNDPFEPEQLSFASGEMASRERGEDSLIHQGAVDE